MNRWWHPRRCHGGPYANWLVLWFTKRGRLDLQLRSSRWDALESCWHVAANARRDAKECERIQSKDGVWAFEIPLDVGEACAIRLMHRPMTPDLQRRPVNFGAATFLPNEGVVETRVLELEHASGSPNVETPVTASEVVRRLLEAHRPDGRRQVPKIELRSTDEGELEIRLPVRLTTDVLVLTGNAPIPIPCGERVDVLTLDQSNFTRLLTIPAGDLFRTTRVPRPEFVGVPIALEADSQRGTIGEFVRFAHVAAPGRVEAEFVDNNNLHLRWQWGVHPRMRVRVRAVVGDRGRSSRISPIVKHVTHSDYTDRGYALVRGEEIDALLDATGTTVLEVTIDLLVTDDTGGIGTALKSSTTRVPVPERRIRQ